MNLTLHVWRQVDANAKGKLVTYKAKDISPNSSFLEMLDSVNEDLIEAGEEPITSITTVGKVYADRAR